jgi:hypothetical protein
MKNGPFGPFFFVERSAIAPMPRGHARERFL